MTDSKIFLNKALEVFIIVLKVFTLMLIGLYLNAVYMRADSFPEFLQDLFVMPWFYLPSIAMMYSIYKDYKKDRHSPYYVLFFLLYSFFFFFVLIWMLW